MKRIINILNHSLSIQSLILREHRGCPGSGSRHGCCWMWEESRADTPLSAKMDEPGNLTRHLTPLVREYEDIKLQLKGHCEDNF